MSIRTYHNSRNEAASTDGTRWWIGTATDERSIALGELQPVSTLFPETDGGICHATVVKARAVFISALRRSAPTVAPSDDAERAVLRKAWDDAVKFAGSRDVFSVGVPVFDGKRLLVGTADALCNDAKGEFTYCYAPDGYRWAGETNAVVRMLHRGLPIDAEDDPFGAYTMRELSRALLAVVTRDQTEWYARKISGTCF